MEVEYVDFFIQSCISTLSFLGPIAGIVLILFESILPILPLSVFITLNMITFGNLFGFVISWIATIVGCTLSFCLFRCFSNKLYRFLKEKDQKSIKLWLKRLSKIPFTSLTLIIAIPFTPAFFVNIAAGLSKMSYKKFFISLLIGKMIMVYFWGYIGTSLLESLTDVEVLIRIIVLLIGTYILSRVVEKKFHVE